jgi:sugar-specific transcriptional regulator TrmB
MKLSAAAKLTAAEVDAFGELGFTATETAAYVALLRESPSTAYRISHAIGRPVANTYKAMAALRRKGAVVADDGGNRMCRAVPPDELLAARESEFQRNKSSVRAALAEIGAKEGDDRVYRLESAEQVLERARRMLSKRWRIVLLDLFPGPRRELETALAGCARRGARVVAKVYEDVSIAGVDTVRARDPEKVLRTWPGQQLSLVCDASVHLLALLGPDLDVVHQAVWSESDFLSCMHHNHLSNEIRFTAQDGVASVRRGRSLDSLSLIQSGNELPGMKSLRRRMSGGKAGS